MVGKPPGGKSLAQQMDTMLKKAEERAREIVVEFLQDLNQEVVEATPVKTGHLRRSWYAAIGQKPSPGGAVTGDPVGVMNAVASQMTLTSTYYAVNGASYAAYVEYGTRYMAARAFVRGTLQRAPEIAEAAATRVLSR